MVSMVKSRARVMLAHEVRVILFLVQVVSKSNNNLCYNAVVIFKNLDKDQSTRKGGKRGQSFQKCCA